VSEVGNIKYAHILLNPPKTGRYTSERMTIEEGFEVSFQSIDYFYILEITEINTVSQFIQMTLSKTPN
jgi:hypothetical protein